MLEPYRTMQRPGQGIVHPDGPKTQHSEYPKHMAHPGYRPGKAGDEVKSPHGFSYHVGGEPIRFPPVLVMDEDQEAYHASQGYVCIGKSDPTAFARAVAAAAPQTEIHEPVLYPKWLAEIGRAVDSAEEEAEALGLIAPSPDSSGEPGETLAVNAEANTLTAPQDRPGAGRVAGRLATASAEVARIDALEQKVDAIAGSLDRLSGMLAQIIGPQAPAGLPSPSTQAPIARQRRTAAAPQAKPERSAESIARGEAIKAGKARKKVEAEAARAAERQTQEPQAQSAPRTRRPALPPSVGHDETASEPVVADPAPAVE